MFGFFLNQPQAPSANSQMEFTVERVSGSRLKMSVEFEDNETCYIGFKNNGQAVSNACSKSTNSKQNVLLLVRA